MKKYLSIFLLFLSCLACGRQTPRNNLQQNNRLRNSTVALVNRYVSGELSEEIGDTSSNEERFAPFCSGIFISENSILTAAHCVDIGIPEVMVRMIRLHPELDERFPRPIGTTFRFSTFGMYEDGRIVDSRIAYVAKFDRVTDLALLRVVPRQHRFFREHVGIRREVSGAHDGDQVYTIGHPGGALWSLTVGRISAVTSRDIGIINASNYTQVDGTIWRGNSGGGLLDERGFLIGICSMVRNDSRQSYFVNHREVLRFLNR